MQRKADELLTACRAQLTLIQKKKCDTKGFIYKREFILKPAWGKEQDTSCLLMCHFSFGGERGIFIRCVVGVVGVSNGSFLPGSYQVPSSCVGAFPGRKVAEWACFLHAFLVAERQTPRGWKFRSHPLGGRVPWWVCFGLQIYCQVSGKISWKNLPVLNQTSISLTPFTDSSFCPAGTV